ncbi:Phosphatidylethanolamine-binding protein 1 [Coemansia sp. Benny D115]|nr:Phosphatidylethanolamine-binding protein 1 [Coemansia sp. Benny D115]
MEGRSDDRKDNTELNKSPQEYRGEHREHAGYENNENSNNSNNSEYKHREESANCSDNKRNGPQYNDYDDKHPLTETVEYIDYTYYSPHTENYDHRADYSNDDSYDYDARGSRNPHDSHDSHDSRESRDSVYRNQRFSHDNSNSHWSPGAQHDNADSQQEMVAEDSLDKQQQEKLSQRNTLGGTRTFLADGGIIPDLLPQSFMPEFQIHLRYKDQQVQLGEVLTMNDTRSEPTVEFDSQPGQVFTVALLDADAPSMSRHGYRAYRHFLVGNLDSADDSTSTILTSYQPPQPGFGTGMHRYALVVLKQDNGRVNFTSADVPESRVRFNVVEWGKGMHMRPVAATFFLVKRLHQSEKVSA